HVRVLRCPDPALGVSLVDEGQRSADVGLGRPERFRVDLEGECGLLKRGGDVVESIEDLAHRTPESVGCLPDPPARVKGANPAGGIDGAIDIVLQGADEAVEVVGVPREYLPEGRPGRGKVLHPGGGARSSASSRRYSSAAWSSSAARRPASLTMRPIPYLHR